MRARLINWTKSENETTISQKLFLSPNDTLCVKDILLILLNVKDITLLHYLYWVCNILQSLRTLGRYIMHWNTVTSRNILLDVRLSYCGLECSHDQLSEIRRAVINTSHQCVRKHWQQESRHARSTKFVQMFWMCWLPQVNGWVQLDPSARLHFQQYRLLKVFPLLKRCKKFDMKFTWAFWYTGSDICTFTTSWRRLRRTQGVVLCISILDATLFSCAGVHRSPHFLLSCFIACMQALKVSCQ